MRVRLLRETTGPNPKFDAEEKLRVEQAGGTYPHHHTITLIPGTEIEHPQAFRLCQTGYMNAPAIAEPIDDEAKARHAQYLKQRPQRLAKLRLHIRNPPKDKKTQAHLKTLAEAYDLDPITGDPLNGEPIAAAGKPKPSK